MKAPVNAKLAIADFGLGNLLSVRLACEHVGLKAEITSKKDVILNADAVILPGVGAFGDAMDTLNRLDLVSVLRDVVASGKPLVGICLGLQLLMTESEEFGTNKGLDIVPGVVKSLGSPMDGDKVLKVPQVGWNSVMKPKCTPDPWAGTMLENVTDGERMYFVHSFYIQPDDDSMILATTKYGQVEFCSALNYGNVFACQFHPERSGERGLDMYRSLAGLLSAQE